MMEASITALLVLIEIDDNTGHLMLLVHGYFHLLSEFSAVMALDPVEQADLLRVRGCQIMLFGHTHRPRAWRVSGQEALPITALAFDLDWSDSDVCYIVNVGPLQRPQPGELNNGRPCYLFYDSVAGRMEHVLL